MSKRGVLVLLALLLAACGSRSSRDATSCSQQTWNGTFGTCLPAGWKVLSEQELKSFGVPEETVAAFQRTEAQGGQFDTVTVTQEALASPMTTRQYSEANILAVSTLPEYKLLDQSAVTIDSDEAELHVFSARPIAEAPMRRYYQVSAVSGQTGYTFTASFPLSIEDAQSQAVTFILNNVTFTKLSE